MFLLRTIYTLLLIGVSSFVFSSPVFAVDQDLIINEVMYDFPDSDTNHEWIELFNSGDSPVTIVGGSSGGSWRINDGSNHTFGATAVQGSMVIDSQDYVIITKSASTFLADNPGFTGNIIESSISLGNTSATVGLRINADGALWGQLTYQNTQGAAGDGNSLQKTSDGSIIAALPNPGVANATSPAPTLTPTIVPTATPTNIPTPTKVPTPTKAPTPTKTPTSTPTKNPTPSPTSKVSPLPSPTHGSIEADALDSFPTSVLGEKTDEIKPSPTDLPVKVLGSTQNRLSLILISIGVFFLTLCGILAFRLYRSNRENEGE